MAFENIRHFMIVVQKIGYGRLFGGYKDFIPIWLFNLIFGACAFVFQVWLVFAFNLIISIGSIVLWISFRSREERGFVTLLSFSNSMVSITGIYFENQEKSNMYEWFLLLFVGISFLISVAFFRFTIKRDYYKEKSKKVLPIGTGATFAITFLAMGISRLISRNVSQDIMKHLIVYLLILGVFISTFAVAMGWYVFYYSRKNL